MWETRINMEKKIVDYKCIIAQHLSTLEGEIKKHLVDGWSLYGNITVTFSSEGYTGCFFREMVKYEQ